MRTDDASKFREVRIRSLPMEQRATQLIFQLLDGPREGWLRHVAPLGRVSEVQVLAKGEEIANLMHFHGRASGSSAHMDRGPPAFATGTIHESSSNFHRALRRVHGGARHFRYGLDLNQEPLPESSSTRTGGPGRRRKYQVPVRRTRGRSPHNPSQERGRRSDPSRLTGRGGAASSYWHRGADA